MVKKVLLSLGVLASAITVQAQGVFTETFDAEQTKDSTEIAWYQYINQQEGDVWQIVNQELSIYNSDNFICDNQTWQRGIKFRNLPLVGGKLYRLSFDVKATSTYTNEETFEENPGHVDVKLQQGDENADICLLGGDGSDQRDQITILPGETKNYSKVFCYADEAAQMAKYEEQCAGKENYAPNKFFASINVFNPGEYTLDNVALEEVDAIESVEFNGYNIRLNYGNAINASALCAGKKRYILDASAATVKVNGTEVEIDGVEAQADGNLYIFTVDEIDAAATVEVSFKNPGAVQFTGAWKGISLDFEAMTASYSDDSQLADAIPFSYEEPEVLTTVPESGSFALDGNIKEFIFNFDHEIVTAELKAVMSTGAELTVKDGTPDAAETVTFVYNGEDLAKGAYSITVSGIVGAMSGTPAVKGAVLSFEVGKIQLAETVYTELFTNLLTGANGGQPDGWTIMVGGENWTGGTPKDDNGSACRNLNVTGSDGQEYTAFYLCDRDGYTYMMYGDQEDARLTLPAGDIEFSIIALGHEDPARTVEFRLEDMDGNVVAEGSGLTQVNANTAGAFTTIAAAGTIPVKFNNPSERNLILKIHEPQGGYTACRVLGFKAQTYVETEGDKSDAEIVFASNFSGGNMPAEGTGWLCYDNNNQLTPGSGRNGTSGMLERNFHAKMQSAAFFRECGDNADAAHRIEYGNGNGVDNGFELANGNYEIVYYAGTWNDAAGNANGTSMVHFQIIDAKSGAVFFTSDHVNVANFENGGACNGQADKVVESLTIPAGTYMLKAWGTHNTVWGGLSIEKEGSKAAKYYTKLADAVAEAKAQLEAAEDAQFDGTTKSALIDAVARYSGDLDMHTAAEFDAAVAEVLNLTKALKTRCETVTKYAETMTGIAEMIGTIEEKYNALECVQTLKETYAKYENTTAQQLEDAELIEATATLDFAYQTTKHMTTEGVKTLTEHLVAMAAQIVQLDATMAENEVVLAAGNAISNDQELAGKLRVRLTKAIYEAIVAGDPFIPLTYDEDLNEYKDSVQIEATHYVINPNIYCVAEKHDATNISNYPGWNIEEGRETFGLRPNYGWGGWTGSATHLINNNMFLGIGWVGDEGVNVWTDVESLPVGLYDISIQTMDRSGAGDWDGTQNSWPNPERQKSYIYYQQDGMEEPVTKPFNNENIGQYYGFTPDVIADVTLDGETTAAVKLGAYIHAQESFAAIQKVDLKLKAAKPGFDYAAAAAKLAEQIEGEATAIENVVAPAGEPTSVKYYTIDGKLTNQPKGVAIKVATWANGFVKISKVLVK